MYNYKLVKFIEKLKKRKYAKKKKREAHSPKVRVFKKKNKKNNGKTVQSMSWKASSIRVRSSLLNFMDTLLVAGIDYSELGMQWP